jgi:hypothetical protein
LHNILIHLKEERDASEVELEVEERDDDDEIIEEIRGYRITAAESRRASIKRDEIAIAMWTDYQARRGP